MLKKIIIISCLFAAIVIMSCEQGTKKVILKYKHQAGDEFIYETSTKNNIKLIKADTVARENSTEAKYKMISNIKRVLEDSTYESYQTSIRIFETIVTPDSTIERGEDTAWVRIVYLKPDGKIIDVEFPNSEDEVWAEYIKESYKQGLPVFPSNEVSIGYSWTQTTQVLLDKETSVSSTTYSVQSFAREKGYDCVVIEYEGNMVIPVKPSPKSPEKREGVDRVDMKGVMYFAYKEGVAVSFRENWVMKGDRKLTKEDGEVSFYSTILEGDYSEFLVERKTN